MTTGGNEYACLQARRDTSPSNRHGRLPGGVQQWWWNFVVGYQQLGVDEQHRRHCHRKHRGLLMRPCFE
jgi:hypothetical protein